MKIIVFHSFYGRAGKSQLIKNIGDDLSEKGKKIGIVDCSFLSPFMHFLCGFSEAGGNYFLNDYLKGMVNVEDVFYEIKKDGLYLFPAKLDTGEILKILRDGLNLEKLSFLFYEISKKFNFDYLLVDTFSGINESSLLCLSMADTVVLPFEENPEHISGNRISLEIIKKLKVSNKLIILNKVKQKVEIIKSKMEKEYEEKISSVIPYFTDKELISCNLSSLL